MKNIVMIEGKITELAYPSENVTKFTVMLCDDKKPAFIDCTTFGEDAQYAKEFFQKGDTVSINGSLKNNSYVKDGQKIYKTELYVRKQTLVEKAGQPTELTKEEAIRKHREMWTWLAEQNQLIVENGNDRVAVSKRDYFRPHGIRKQSEMSSRLLWIEQTFRIKLFTVSPTFSQIVLSNPITMQKEKTKKGLTEIIFLQMGGT